MLENSPVSIEKRKERVDLGEGKYLELTEVSPGVFKMTEENVTDDHAWHVGFTLTDELEAKGATEVDGNDDGNSYTFGHVQHLKYDGVEIDAFHPREAGTAMVYAPSMEKAIEVLKMVNPHAYNPHDL